MPPHAPPEPQPAEATGEAGPWTPAEAAPPADAAPAEPPAAKEPARPTIETALGTRWAVWVGGLALALGGIFLVRYSIEAGIFGPELRLILAAILGVALVGAGEFIRRTGFQMPVEGVANAYVPGILTAAGAFTLFGTVYAAHGIYGFIGPTAAFTLLGLIGIATIAASLIHGQALAGVGVVGSYVTPVLVSSEAPNQWALFGFIAIVLAAAVFIARLRDWKLLAGAGLFGAGLWTLLYVGTARPLDLPVVAFITAVTLAVLAFVWLGRRQQTGAVDIPSIVPGFLHRAHRGRAVRRSRDRPGQRPVLRRRLHRGAWSRSRSTALRPSRCCMPPAPRLQWCSSATPFPEASASTCSANRSRWKAFRCCRPAPASCGRASRSARSLLLPDCGTRAASSRSRASSPPSGRHGASPCRWSSCSRSGWPSAISTAISFMPRSPSRLPRCSWSPAR